MDGLLCIYEMNPSETKYLDMACKTADIILQAQQAEGFWYNYFEVEDSKAAGGIGEKSTALWSWLLYRLYELVPEARYLAGARRALEWCISNQYYGEDSAAGGGIVAVSEQSGIIFRPYFRMACTYTSSFIGLAALKELELQEKGNY